MNNKEQRKQRKQKITHSIQIQSQQICKKYQSNNFVSAYHLLQIAIIMASKLFNTGVHFFSVFKKKCLPVESQSYKSLNHFYNQLYTFQKTLSYLQVLKLPKKFEDYDKKFRKLYRSDGSKLLNVPMTMTYSYQYYTKRVDELYFGTQELPLDVNAGQLLTLTTSMVQNDLNMYQKVLIANPQNYQTMFQRMNERFINIQERLARILFKGYTLFSQASSKVSLFEERQYKGQFKFILIEDLQIIQKLSQSLYHIALFNRLTTKLALAAELAISLHWQKLSQKALSKLLFCLTINGKSLKIIESNFYSFAEKLKNYPFQLLFYMIMSGTQDNIFFSQQHNKLILEPKNSTEQLIANLQKKIMLERFNVQIQVKDVEQYKLPVGKHGGEVFFEYFLQRHHYQFVSKPNELLHHTIYRIQQKQFICLDHWLVKMQDFGLNGLGLILREYLLKKDQSLKHINWPRMFPMEKRVERDEYIISKFKGMQKPKWVKVRYYD